MKPESQRKLEHQKIAKAVVNALVTKKEIKTRFQNGENLRKIAKEKGLEVVLPL